MRSQQPKLTLRYVDEHPRRAPERDAAQTERRVLADVYRFVLSRHLAKSGVLAPDRNSSETLRQDGQTGGEDTKP